MGARFRRSAVKPGTTFTRSAAPLGDSRMFPFPVKPSGPAKELNTGKLSSTTITRFKWFIVIIYG
jgi:hypothetical protein